MGTSCLRSIVLLGMMVCAVWSQCRGGLTVLSGQEKGVPINGKQDGAGAWSVGTTYTLHCQRQYYYENQQLSRGQIITCKNKDWQNQLGQPVQPCVGGCFELTDKNLENATYMSSVPPVKVNYLQNGEVLTYFPKNSFVKTQCKEGYVFVDLKFREMGYDEHICSGENSRWSSPMFSNDKVPGRIPARCDALCYRIQDSDIPSTVIKVTDQSVPNLRIVKGKEMVIPNTSYLFRCKPGFKYPSGHKEQELRCTGGTAGYRDMTIKKYQAKVDACVENGCSRISAANGNLNPNSEVSEQNCGSDAKIVSLGCEVTIRCNKDFYYFPDNKNSDGQKLKCTDDGWKDVNGNHPKTDNGKIGDKCEKGCPIPQTTTTNIVSDVSSNDKFRNQQQFIAKIGSKITTQCEDNHVNNANDTPDKQRTFDCKENGWMNINPNDNGINDPFGCKPACAVPLKQTGTSVRPEFTKYVLKGESITVTCDQSYEPPKGSGLASPQQLLCEGGSAGYKDPKTNQRADPMTCVKAGAPGCTLVNQNNAPNTDVTTSGQCVIIDGLIPKGCKITMKCKNGYFPKNPSDGDNKDLVCEAGTNGYVDGSGKKNATLLECVPGCQPPIDTAAAKIVGTKPTTNQYGLVSAGTLVKYTCNNGFEPKDDDDRRKPSFEYKCIGGPSKWAQTDGARPTQMGSTPGDICIGQCDALSGVTFNPAYVVMSSPAISNNKVSANDRYRYKCAEGYQFPEGTPASKNNEEVLVCVGGDQGYADKNGAPDNKNAKPTECTRGSPPGCTPFDINNAPDGVTVKSHNGKCTLNNGKTPPGCEMTLTCGLGKYPTTMSLAKTNEQKLECVDDGRKSNWVNDNDQVDTPMKCAPGCESTLAPNAESSVSGDSPSEQSGDRKLYTVGSMITVKCKPGSISKNNYEPKSLDETDEMTYECRADSKFFNKKYFNLEDNLGESCVKPCVAVEDTAGRQILSSPATTQIGGVSMAYGDRAKYTLQCKTGYSYPPNSEPAKDNMQTLTCDPATGKYLDTTNGKNAIVNGAEECKKDQGDGCPDLTTPYSKVTRDNCGSQFNDGCEVEYQCKDGYIPSNPLYHPTGSMKLKCEKGNDWKNEENNVITSGLECVPACPVAGNNRTQIQTEKNVVTVGNVKYFKTGQEVMIKCIGDRTVWTVDAKTTNDEHKFVCQGGNEGYKRVEDNSLVTTLGTGCEGTCDPLPPGAKTTPQIYYIDGKSYVASKSFYEYTCKNEKYEYPPTSPHHLSGKEKVECNGETRKYQTPIGATFTAPEECVRKKNLPECEAPNVDTKSTSVTTNDQCNNDGGYYGTGCAMTVKCKSGFKPQNEKSPYLTETGAQIITCQSSGSGGSWTDQYNRKTTLMTCVEGCIKASVSTSSNTNTETIIYTNTNAGGLHLECKKVSSSNNTVVTTNNPYICEVDPKERNNTNSDCKNGCLALTVRTNLNVEIANIVETKHLSAYIFDRSEYKFTCAKGYTYPAGTRAQKEGHQILRCDGKTGKYVDPMTEKMDAEIVACEPVKGCSEPKKNEFVTIDGSGSVDGRYMFGATISMRCTQGYPKDKFHLYNGKKMVCDETKGNWKPVNEIFPVDMECVKGCATLSPSEIFETISKNSTTNTHTDATGSYTCASSFTVATARKMIDELRKNPYFCPIDENTLERNIVIGTCNGTCKGISTDDIKPGTLVEGSSFRYENMQFIGFGNMYKIRCDAGYVFPLPGRDIQLLKCTPNGLEDQYTYRIVEKPIICEKESLCTTIPKSDGLVLDDAYCTKTSSGVNVGCKAKLSCEAGYKPADQKYNFKDYQQLNCETTPTGVHWIDENRLPQKPLTCEKGCLEANNRNSETNTFFIGELKVVCSTESQTCTGEGAKYCCNASEKPHSCTNSCPTLSIPAYVTASAPKYDFDRRFVVDTDGYTLTCQKGIFEDSNKPTKTLICAADKNAYLDVDTNKYITEVTAKCIPKPGGCKTALADSNMSPSFTCKPENGIAGDNCQLDISCDTGYQLSTQSGFTFSETYTCVADQEQWRKHGTQMLYETIPDKCVKNEVSTCIATTSSDLTVTRLTGCNNDRMEKAGCKVKVECRPGYEVVNRNDNKDRTLSVEYECMGVGEQKDTWLRNGKTSARKIEDLCERAGPEGCSISAIDNGVAKVNFKCFYNGDIVQAGCEAVITCPDETKPTEKKFYTVDSQTVRCVNKGNGGYKWEDANTNGPLTCEPGCVRGKYPFTTKLFNTTREDTRVSCHETDDKIPPGYKHYCDARDISHKASGCINGCALGKIEFAKYLQTGHTASAQAMKTSGAFASYFPEDYYFQKSVIRLRCRDSDEVFEDTKKSEKTITCNDNETWKDESGNIIDKKVPNCVKIPCDLKLDESVTTNIVCEKNGNGIMIGCKLYLVCDEGYTIEHKDTTNTNTEFYCDGKSHTWYDKNKKSKKTPVKNTHCVPVEPINCKHKKQASFPEESQRVESNRLTEQTLQGNTATLDQDLRAMIIEVECSDGYRLKDDPMKDAFYEIVWCSEEGWKSNKTGRIYDLKKAEFCEKGCVEGTIIDDESEKVEAICEILNNDNYGDKSCEVEVRCKSGYKLNNGKWSKQTPVTCRDDGNWVDNNGTVLAPPKEPFCQPVCNTKRKDETTQVDVYCGYSGDGIKYNCKMYVQCSPGYVTTEAATTFNEQLVTCDGETNNWKKKNGDPASVKIETTKFCEKPLCPIVSTEVQNVTNIECTKVTEHNAIVLRCRLSIVCGSGYVVTTESATETRLEVDCHGNGEWKPTGVEAIVNSTAFFSGNFCEPVATTTMPTTPAIISSTNSQPNQCNTQININTTNINIKCYTENVNGDVIQAGCKIFVKCGEGQVKTTTATDLEGKTVECDSITNTWIVSGPDSDRVNIVTRSDEFCVEEPVCSTKSIESTTVNYVVCKPKITSGHGLIGRCKLYIQCGDGKIVNETWSETEYIWATCDVETERWISKSGAGITTNDISMVCMNQTTTSKQTTPTTPEATSATTPTPSKCTDESYFDEFTNATVQCTTNKTDGNVIKHNCNIFIHCGKGYVTTRAGKTSESWSVVCDEKCGLWSVKDKPNEYIQLKKGGHCKLDTTTSTSTTPATTTTPAVACTEPVVDPKSADVTLQCKTNPLQESCKITILCKKEHTIRIEDGSVNKMEFKCSQQGKWESTKYRDIEYDTIPKDICKRECKSAIQPNSNSTVTYDCGTKDDELFSVGCEAVVSCEDGNMPTDPMYSATYSKYTMKCNKEGRWTFNDKPVDPLSCENKCVDPTSGVVKSTVRKYVNLNFGGEIHKCYETLYSETVTTTNPKDTAEKYKCKVEEGTATTSDADCENVCYAIPPQKANAAGIIIEKGQSLDITIGRTKYIFYENGNKLTVSCKYQGGKFTSQSYNTTEIVCNSKTKEWVDEKSGHRFKSDGKLTLSCDKLEGPTVAPKASSCNPLKLTQDNMNVQVLPSDGIPCTLDEPGNECQVNIQCKSGYALNNADGMSCPTMYVCNPNKKWFYLTEKGEQNEADDPPTPRCVPN